MALWGGIEHISHSLHDKQGAEKVANVIAGGAEAFSGGVGTLGLLGHGLSAIGLEGAGATLGGIAGSGVLGTLGPLAGALAAGWSVGTFLDETFGLSDKLSGLDAIERAGMVRAKVRGVDGIADNNRRWVDQEVERLRDEHGARGPLAMIAAREKKATSLVDDKQLIRSAQAVYEIQEAVQRQQRMAERFHGARAAADGVGAMFGADHRARALDSAVAHYAD
ncbi:MAG TPA: hypothetical protein VKE22_20010 [Haliangiales bacterium]|nr:hypothetical protein [Haliangiales bacterium]